MRSKRQIANTQRAWRILRMKGVLAFLREMDVPEAIQSSVEKKLSFRIYELYRKELA